MQDLRSKLLAAGLITQQQLETSAKQKSKPKSPHKPKAPKAAPDFEAQNRQRHVDELKRLNKGEQYELIRKWVIRNRLDNATALAGEELEKFFYTKADGSLDWLSVPKGVLEALQTGQAGIMAFMSNHGLAHCVAPRDICEDVREVFSDWVRVLNDVGSNSTDS